MCMQGECGRLNSLVALHGSVKQVTSESAEAGVTDHLRFRRLLGLFWHIP